VQASGQTALDGNTIKLTSMRWRSPPNENGSAINTDGFVGLGITTLHTAECNDNSAGITVAGYLPFSGACIWVRGMDRFIPGAALIHQVLGLHSGQKTMIMTIQMEPGVFEHIILVIATAGARKM